MEYVELMNGLVKVNRTYIEKAMEETKDKYIYLYDGAVRLEVDAIDGVFRVEDMHYVRLGNDTIMVDDKGLGQVLTYFKIHGIDNIEII